jgi:hypothetical protein
MRKPRAAGVFGSWQMRRFFMGATATESVRQTKSTPAESEDAQKHRLADATCGKQWQSST